MGSYEPGEGWEKVGWMGEWIVSVVWLDGEKGRAVSRNLKLGHGECRLGPLGGRKRRALVIGNEARGEAGESEGVRGCEADLKQVQ